LLSTEFRNILSREITYRARRAWTERISPRGGLLLVVGRPWPDRGGDWE